MTIDIKISKKRVEYTKAIKLLERRILKVYNNKAPELIWLLEHPDVYTSGLNYNNSEIIDKKIKIIKTNRGGKITYHGPGQIIFYFIINLNKRKKDIRWFVSIIEKSIKDTLNEFNIKSVSDKKNIGIWIKKNNERRKIASIGIKIKKWVAYHGFSLNYKTNLDNFSKIIPCGISDLKLINFMQLRKSNLDNLKKRLINNFLKNLEN